MRAAVSSLSAWAEDRRCPRPGVHIDEKRFAGSPMLGVHMDNKHETSMKDQSSSARSASRWIAVIAPCTLLLMAGGWYLGPRLQAQVPAVPIAPPSIDAPNNGVAAPGANGKVGFVMVDPFEMPLGGQPEKKVGDDTSNSPLPPFPTKQPVAPPAPRVNPFPLVVDKAPAFKGLESPPAPMTKQVKTPVAAPKVETTGFVVEIPEPAPTVPVFVADSAKPIQQAPTVIVPSPKQSAPMANEIKPVQPLNLFSDKSVAPPIVLPAPQLEVAAQKDVVPVPLPQVVPPPGGEKPGVLPQPRPVQVFPGLKEGAVRMPVLGDSEVTPLGMTPKATPKVLETQAKYIDGFIDPNNTIDLIQARARLMMLKDTPKRIQVSDETVVTYSVINNKEITLLGKTPGNTVLNLWFATAEDKNKETVLSYLVRVFPDPEAKERLERVYRALEIEINKNFPDSLVRLKLVGDKVMVTGQAHDIFEATQILKIVVANTPGATKIPSEGLANTPRPETPNAKEGATPGQGNYISSGSPSVINMMRIGGVQQVMLRVVVAEVNRSAARSIGLNFSLTNNQGITYLQNLTGGITNGGFGAAAAAANLAGGVTPLGNIPIRLDNGQVALSVNALKRLNYAKSLAEPNLVTMNGQPASFLAGGQFPVPVVSGNAVGGLQGTQFVPFGVQLQFTPFITDKDRIRLTVNATVSTRDASTGTNLGGGGGGGGGLGGGGGGLGGGGTFVPGLNSRTFASTVEMRDGQTLAVAGLIQTNTGADRDQIPFLGDIPFLNRFTGFDRTSAAEQELVILITPELVQPMYHQQLPRLPGSDLFEPSDLEFYLLGRLEGRRMTDFRAPAMTDLHRIRQYNRVEQNYIFGPAGFYNVPLIPK